MKYRSNYIIMIAPYFGYLPFLVKTSDKSSKHWSVALYKDVNSAQRNWTHEAKDIARRIVNGKPNLQRVGPISWWHAPQSYKTEVRRKLLKCSNILDKNRQQFLKIRQIYWYFQMASFTAMTYFISSARLLLRHDLLRKKLSSLQKTFTNLHNDLRFMANRSGCIIAKTKVGKTYLWCFPRTLTLVRATAVKW